MEEIVRNLIHIWGRYEAVVEAKARGMKSETVASVGKLLATAKPNGDAFRTLILKIRRTNHELEVELVRENMFTFHDLDKMRIRYKGLFLGEPIGVVKELDLGASVDCIGKFTVVRVQTLN
ncbi:hypothetical protein JRO89_XS01G0246000 [Xanthoceras sorbifolium]|uniref:Uncharacterized protein n=1 Tax=Xanthoceras sorbifolium TaxID=99658 RepID=A0ABQ8IL12_9ROSI|nr:hypothetical protein JRO89_XS01G0246000 [Xanthoceras sorbifolium]